MRQVHDTAGVEADAGQTGWRKARRPQVIGTALSVAGFVNLAGALVGLLNAGLTWSVVLGALVSAAVISAFGVALARIGRRGVVPIATRYPRNNPN